MPNVFKITILFVVFVATIAFVSFLEFEETVVSGFAGTNGKIVFQSKRDGDDFEIYTMNSDGSQVTRLTNNDTDDERPGWSPDGRKIVFAHYVNSNNSDIWSMNADGSNQIRLTTASGREQAAQWSSDGTKIIYQCGEPANGEICIMNADGSNNTNITSSPNLSESGPVWSPRGDKIAFSRSPAGQGEGNANVFTSNIDGSNPVQLTDNPAADFGAAWSPDATKIAFRSGRDDPGNPQSANIYVMNADGSNETRLTEDGRLDRGPAWSPDGTKIAFYSNRLVGGVNNQHDIYVMNADGTNETNITPNSSTDDYSPDWGVSTGGGGGTPTPTSSVSPPPTTTTITPTPPITRCDYVVGANETHKTIESALSAIGNNGAGKVLCVRDDKIYVEDNVKIQISGSPNAWFIIKRHNSNTSPTYKIDDANCNSGCSGGVGELVRITGSYIEVHDLEVLRTKKTGIGIENTTNVKLINTKVSNTFGHGIQVYDSDEVLIDKCIVRRAASATPEASGENVRSSHFSNRVIVQNCLITEDANSRGGVLNSGQSTYTLFRNNELYLNESNNMHLGNGENVIYENNLVSLSCAADKGTGLYRLAERPPYFSNPNNYHYTGTNLTIRNNLVVKMGKGLVWDGCKGIKPNENCPFNNVTIANNTVVGIGTPNIDADERGYVLDFGVMPDPVNNVRTTNNLFHSVPDGKEDLFNRMTGSFSFGGNVWSDVSDLPAGDILLNNWSGVFTANPSLTTCEEGRVDPLDYCVSPQYAGKGADCTKVGIDGDPGGGFDPPNPTNTPLAWNYTLQDLVRVYEDTTLDVFNRDWWEGLDILPQGVGVAQAIYCKNGQPSTEPDVGDERLYTALGCIPIGSASAFTIFILEIALTTCGGVTLLLIIISTYKIMTSNGDPKKLQSGKELLTASISGLLLIMFSAFALRIIGSDILNLPGF